MSLYLLDTNIASYAIKGAEPEVRRRLAGVPTAQTGVSAVTEAELRYGVARRPGSPRLAEIVDAFLLRASVYPWDSAAAREYGLLRAALEGQGRAMGNLDMMIAAHAIALGAVLITHDRAFARIKQLKTEDWTRA